VWLWRDHRPLVAIALDNPGQTYRWRDEIWPLQWRLAINWLCGYLLTQINVPILFHTHGPVVAGQFGLSMTIVNTIGLVSQSWLLRHVPGMAQAAALRDWRLLDRLFWRNFGVTLGVFAAGATGFVGVVWRMADLPVVHRLLPWPQLLALAVFTFTSQFIGGLALHLRSFRREPFVWLSLFGTLITVPAAFFATRHYSSAGLVAVLAAANVALNLPVGIALWHRCNSMWRATA
jgi:O-antigen/teichoic acid export membrane protein